MIFLYARVSTKEQNTDRQTGLKIRYNCDEVYIDKMSGKDTNRPAYNEMISKLRTGDTVVVESYSRASRSTKDLLELVESLNSKKVNFISVKENIDTTTPAGRLMFVMFAGLYQFERECLLERQSEGIKIAREKGNYKNVGRKKIKLKEDMFNLLYKDWRKGNLKTKDFMTALGLKQRTFYRRITEYEKNQI